VNSLLASFVFDPVVENGLPSALLDAAVKGFVLLAFACIAAFALRRAPASARHLAWLAALACALLLPVCSWLLPGWRVLPAWMRWKEAPRPLAAPALPPPERPASLENIVTPPMRHVPDGTEPSTIERPPSITPAAAPTVAAPRTFRLGSETWLVLWAAGTALLLVPLAWSLCALAVVMRRARPAGEGLASEVAAISRELGLRGPAYVRLGAPEAMPMVCGIFRAHLLLPSSAVEWPAARLRAVLLHELAHLRRRDPLALLVAQLARAVHWFNPLVWFAVHQLRIEQEQACDDFVLRHGIRASEYASDLLAVATGLRPQPGAAAALTMARPARIEGRITSILDGARNRASLTRRLIFATAILAAIIALPLAMLSAADEKGTEAPELAPSKTLASPVDKQAEWGKASAKGVQVGIRAEKREWKGDETPSLSLSLRNTGNDPLQYLGLVSEECQIEVDGLWYGSTRPHFTSVPGQNFISVPRRRADPGETKTMTVNLSGEWARPVSGNQPPWNRQADSAWGEHLKLSPGKHTIRVLFRPPGGALSETISNPVEIEIGGNTAPTPSAAASLYKGAKDLPLVGVFLVAKEGAADSVTIPLERATTLNKNRPVGTITWSPETVTLERAPILTTVDFTRLVVDPVMGGKFTVGVSLSDEALKKYSAACEQFLGREKVWVIDGVGRTRYDSGYASPGGGYGIDITENAAQAAELQKKFSAALVGVPAPKALPTLTAAEWDVKPKNANVRSAYEIFVTPQFENGWVHLSGLYGVHRNLVDALGKSPVNAAAFHALRRRLETEPQWKPGDLAAFLDEVAAIDPNLVNRAAVAEEFTRFKLGEKPMRPAPPVAVATYKNTKEMDDKDGRRAREILLEHKIPWNETASAGVTVSVPAPQAAEARKLLAAAVETEGLRLTIVEPNEAPAARVEVTPETVAELTKKIAAVLPEGWKVAYDKETSWLAISRDEPVMATTNAPSIGAHEEPKLKKYQFELRVEPLVPLVEYRRRVVEKAEIEKQIEALGQKLRTMKVPAAKTSFSGRTEEEKALVAQYDQLLKAQPQLPDFYFKDVSLSRAWNYTMPVNARQRLEFRQLEEKIEKLFTAYPKE
jgi:beta-lactamase regulating signal transducer with metallopeptidase domain